LYWYKKGEFRGEKQSKTSQHENAAVKYKGFCRWKIICGASEGYKRNNVA